MANDAPLLLDVTRLIWRRWSGLRPTGIDRICLAWVEHFAPESQAVIIHQRRQIILSFAASQALFHILSESENQTTAKLSFRQRLAGFMLRHGAGLALERSGRGRLWLNAGHTGLDVTALPAWCHNANVRPVYLVHDLIPITHPQFCRKGEDHRHHRRMKTMLASGHGIVANSGHTLETLSAFANGEGVEMPPATVAWPGTQQLLPITAFEPATSLFIILGTIEGRKNHLLLFAVWEQLFLRFGFDTPQLLVIGRRGWQAEAAFAWLDARPCGDRVIETGPLDDAAIAHHLSNARALLFPSFAEGYGLPLVEALAVGVPVIASDLPVFSEIGQGVPDLLSTTSETDWQEAIIDYAHPDSLGRNDQMIRLAQFSAPSWPAHFTKLDAFLAQLSA